MFPPYGLSVVIATVLSCGVVVAGPQTDMPTSLDQMFGDESLAGIIAIGQLSQLQLYETLEKRVTDARVKDYLVVSRRERQAELESLHPLAPIASQRSFLGDLDDMGPSARRETVVVRVSSPPVNADAAPVLDAVSARGFDILELEREVVRHQLASWNKRSQLMAAREIEREFVEQQVAWQLAHHDRLTAFQRFASPRLKPALDAAMTRSEAQQRRLRQLQREVHPASLRPLRVVQD